MLEEIELLKKTLGIPASIQEAGINGADVLAKLADLAEDVFNNQCTGSPLMNELTQRLLDSDYGRALW